MKTRSLLVPILMLMSSSPLPGAERVSYFRRHGGVATDDTRRLPVDLGRKENLVWRQPLAPGHSTPCVQGDLVFVTTASGSELATLALERKTGALRWKRTVRVSALERFHRTGSPASCTPACDGERVYVYFGSYGLLCYDLAGRRIWEHKVGPFQDEFGANSSPVLAGELVILNQDHDVDCFLLALDRRTGKVVWRTARAGFTRSYSTPVIRTVDGREQVIVAGSRQVASYDLATGEKRWWVNGTARIVITTPCQTDRMLYVASWTDGADAGARISMPPWTDARKRYDKNDDNRIRRDELPAGDVLERFFRIDMNQDGGLGREEWSAYARVFDKSQNTLLAIRPGGEGDVTASRVEWTYRRALPYVPSPLVYRGVLYLVKNGGIVTSLDPDRGEVWKQARVAGRGDYYASPTAGDGKIYLASQRGVVTVLAAKAEWSVLGSHDFGERIAATPVLHDGAVYVRTEEALYRIEPR